MQLTYVDVKNAHLSARGDEEVWVKLLDESSQYGEYATLERLLFGARKAASAWEDDNARKLVSDGLRGAPTIFFAP